MENNNLVESQDSYDSSRSLAKHILMFLGIALALTLTGVFIVLINKYGLEFILKRNIVLGKWIYFFTCLLQPIALPVPEPVTVFAGSAVFGSTHGFLIAFSGTIIGIITMFWISRIGGYKLVEKLVDSKQLERYRSLVVRNEFIILIGLFILPILPDEVICVGAGVSGFSFKKFASIAFIAKGITSFAYSRSLKLTQLIKEIPVPWLLAIAAVSISIYFIVRYIGNKKINK